MVRSGDGHHQDLETWDWLGKVCRLGGIESDTNWILTLKTKQLGPFDSGQMSLSMDEVAVSVQIELQSTQSECKGVAPRDYSRQKKSCCLLLTHNYIHMNRDSPSIKTNPTADKLGSRVVVAYGLHLSICGKMKEQRRNKISLTHYYWQFCSHVAYLEMAFSWCVQRVTSSCLTRVHGCSSL